MTAVPMACTNCSAPNVSTYCAQCGERQPSHHDFSVRGLLTDVFHESTSIDGRLVRTLLALLAKPGLLTREWFEGHRSRYVKPFSLFVLLNVAFFIIQPHTGLLSYKYPNYVYGSNAGARKRVEMVEKRRAGVGDTPEQFEVRFNAALQDQKKSLLVFCIPVMALVLVILYAWRKRYFAEHLVFSVHTYAFLLLFLFILVPVLRLVFPVLRFAGVSPEFLASINSDSGFTLLLGAVMVTYLTLALRRVYDDAWLPAIVRSVALFYVIGKLINVYHDVLFYTTLYST